MLLCVSSVRIGFQEGSYDKQVHVVEADSRSKYAQDILGEGEQKAHA